MNDQRNSRTAFRRISESTRLQGLTMPRLLPVGILYTRISVLPGNRFKPLIRNALLRMAHNLLYDRDGILVSHVPNNFNATGLDNQMSGFSGQTGNGADGAQATGFMRRDFVTAALIEQGIALQSQAGTRYAAVFLDYKGVPVDIALRVLLRPSERRKILAPSGQGTTPS